MKISAGEYKGVVDFVNRNNLQKIFMDAVSGDTTIEEYIGEYGEDHDIISGIINDLWAVSSPEEDYWPSHVKFKNGHSNKFTFKP